MKIVSLLPSATEIVCSLGLEDNLVGITHECDYPPTLVGKPAVTSSRISHETMTSREIDHAVRSQLDGHGSIYDLDSDLLKSLKPDIILTQELCDVCAVNYETVKDAAKICAADAQIVSLEPNTLDDIFDNITMIGDITGKTQTASNVVAQFKSRIDDVRQKQVRKRPRVFMLEWLEPPFAPGHWVPEQVEIAGGTCLMGERGRPSVTTTYEAIRESNPEVVVMIPCGYYAADVLRQLDATMFPSNWEEIDAIKNNRVWTLDATSFFSRPGPRVIDGIEILAKIFHPEIFGAPTEREAVRIDADLLRFKD